MEIFLFLIIKQYNSFLYFIFKIFDIFKLYKKKNKLIKSIVNFRGIFFSKFYRSWKYIKFPSIKFWKEYNRGVIKNWFYRKSFKYSFKNSFLIKRYFISYFNLRNFKKYFNSKIILKKKFKFRLRNFFLFFELRLKNVIRRLGFTRSDTSNKYYNFILIKKLKKLILFYKNKNYIVKIGELVILNYKSFWINNFYLFFYNSFFEVNYNIKSFFLIRFPYLNEIIKKWNFKIFNSNLYSLILR